MGVIFNTKIIDETLRIEDRLFDSISKIYDYNSFSDINNYNDQIERIKLYYKKEKYLISKIPKNLDVYNYIMESLNNKELKLKNERFVITRFRNIVNSFCFDLQPKYQNAGFFSDDEYDDEIFLLRKKLLIDDNLLAEYLMSFDGPIREGNQEAISIFNKIKLYNIFLNKSLFDSWIINDFKTSFFPYCTDKEMMKKLNMGKEDYYILREDIVFESCYNLLKCILRDKKKNKTDIVIQDAFFNFKFLLKKLSTNSVSSIQDEFLSLHDNVGNYGFLEDVLNCLEVELSFRDDIIDKNSLCVNYDYFNQIIGIIKFEDKLFDIYDSINFNSNDNDLSKLGNYVDIEKDIISNLKIDSSLFSILNDLFNYNMWIYLSGDVIKKSNLIASRLSNLLPVYKSLKIIPSQSIDSYDFIQKNHLIRALGDLWDMKCQFDDGVVKSEFENIYKYSFFTNPALTDDLILVNGNHKFIFDISNDLSGLDNYEFDYDQNEQLFNLGCDIISFIIDNENNINSVNEYANFQFKINELIDIISNLSDEYNKKLYNYLNCNSFIFSPLRRDLRKIFKDYFNKNNVKVKLINR